MQEHLRQTHEAAKEDLSQWTGPYVSDQGEYYYNDHLKASQTLGSEALSR